MTDEWTSHHPRDDPDQPPPRDVGEKDAPSVQGYDVTNAPASGPMYGADRDRPEKPLPLGRQVTYEDLERLRAGQAEVQFSMLHLFGAMTVAAVLLAIGARVDREIFAGVLGLVTLVALAVHLVFPSSSAFWRLTWWAFLFVYVVTALAAAAGAI